MTYFLQQGSTSKIYPDSSTNTRWWGTFVIETATVPFSIWKSHDCCHHRLMDSFLIFFCFSPALSPKLCIFSSYMCCVFTSDLHDSHVDTNRSLKSFISPSQAESSPLCAHERHCLCSTLDIIVSSLSSLMRWQRGAGEAVERWEANPFARQCTRGSREVLSTERGWAEPVSEDHASRTGQLALGWSKAIQCSLVQSFEERGCLMRFRLWKILISL